MSTCPGCVPGSAAARERDRCLVHMTGVEEAVYALLDEHGWAAHYRCGWDRSEPPSDGLCGKEYAERESVREIVAVATGRRSS